MTQPIRIMGICGSYGLDSANGLMIELVLEQCTKLGAEVITWDNRANPLPFVGEDGCWDNENVKLYKDMANSADAFILSSPEYHGTMSGVMKNSLDWLSFDQTTGKVFGLISTLGGQANTTTLNHMRTSVRWIHGWVIPEQLVIANVKSTFSEDGKILDSALNDRVIKFSESLFNNTMKLCK
ncbi:MAG: NADPH-dependent FMN reductase [Candidatus Poseidoniales archaeon]|jgi:FMN reductase|tara:strand:+ start:697 stop:1242 length:546 start_codon:yes stop_codon:yes gene_type:complete